jgi:hydrogenase maturation protease
MEKITVLGIGNIIMQDEGLGVRVLEAITEKYQFPFHVQLLDGGCLGNELLPFLDGTQKLLIIDALAAHLPPGDCRKFAGVEVKKYFKNKLSVHEIGISEVLASLEIIGEPIEEVVIVGMQPASLDVGLELSDEVTAAVPELIDMVISQLRDWNISADIRGAVA